MHPGLYSETFILIGFAVDAANRIGGRERAVDAFQVAAAGRSRKEKGSECGPEKNQGNRKPFHGCFPPYPVV